MAYTFGIIGFDDLIVVGPDPFGSNATANGSSVGATTFTLAGGATWVKATLNDNDANFEDADGGQDLTAPMVLDGVSYGAGANAETEYSYVVRPVGSTDPSEQVIIYMVEMNGDGHGIATNGPLHEGVTYEIIAIDSNDPVVAFSALAVCFTRGTRIATPRGPARVEDLRIGDLVLTMDHGAQPLKWIGRQTKAGQGGTAPVQVPRGVLGNDAPLTLSPQHRVLRRPRPQTSASGARQGAGGEILTPIKSLIGEAGIAPAPCAQVEYFHLLLARHEVIFAEGAAVESMYPGVMALRALEVQARADLYRVFPELSVMTRQIGADRAAHRQAVEAQRWRGARRFIGPSLYRRSHAAWQTLPLTPSPKGCAAGQGPAEASMRQG